jgi:hypothetical protein
METPLCVFISSVIAGMAAEREAAEAAIRAIPISRPWLFEHSPASSLPLAESYLSKVRACDIFVLLLRDTVTDPVRAEVRRAQGAGKPMLVFLGEKAPADLVAWAQSLGVKYARFRDPDDLAARVAEAVGDELITGYRRHQVPRSDLAPIVAFLDRVAEAGVRIDTRGDRIESTGPVANRGSAVSTGSGVAVAGDGNVVITGKVDRDVNVRQEPPVRSEGHE